MRVTGQRAWYNAQKFVAGKGKIGEEAWAAPLAVFPEQGEPLRVILAFPLHPVIAHLALPLFVADLVGIEAREEMARVRKVGLVRLIVCWLRTTTSLRASGESISLSSVGKACTARFCTRPWSTSLATKRGCVVASLASARCSRLGCSTLFCTRYSPALYTLARARSAMGRELISITCRRKSPAVREAPSSWDPSSWTSNQVHRRAYYPHNRSRIRVFHQPVWCFHLTLLVLIACTDANSALVI